MFQFQLQVLLTPVFALLGLAFLLNTVLQKFRETRHEQVAFGLLFGSVVALGMTTPLSLGEGMIFDTRTLLVGAAVTFVGPFAGLITMISGIICRIVIGGAGTTAGIVGLLLAFTLAVGWSWLLRDQIKNRILKDVALGAAITPSAAAFFVLPFDLAMTLIASVLPTLFMVNVLGMVMIGFVFRREVRQFEYAKTLAAYAQTDSLTNLLNRRGMDAVIKAKKFDVGLGHALFYFDIDNFKQVNDTHGHTAGDAALAIVAARITDSIRDEAVFSRHGGDEFSIYIPMLAATDVRGVADRIRKSVSNQAFSHNDSTFNVSISVGAFWSNVEVPIQQMIDNADAQLMLAKQAGKNRAQVAFDKRGHEEAVA